MHTLTAWIVEITESEQKHETCLISNPELKFAFRFQPIEETEKRANTSVAMSAE